ncbi:hypothetical protein Hanom_Chr01g00086941 [Helianthus anomalus]
MTVNFCAHARKTCWCTRHFGSFSCARWSTCSRAHVPFWLNFIRPACARAHVTNETIRASHTVMPYCLNLVRKPRVTTVSMRRVPAAHVPATSPSMVYLPPGPCIPCASPCARGAKYAIKAPIAHATHAHVCELGCSLREYISVCFHETIRMVCSHLSTPLSFISHPMWDKVPLSQFLSIQCFIHQTLSIDISFIFAPFWTWFSSFRSSFNIEHKPTNNFIKTPQFLIFISSPKFGKVHFLYF